MAKKTINFQKNVMEPISQLKEGLEDICIKKTYKADIILDYVWNDRTGAKNYYKGATSINKLPVPDNAEIVCANKTSNGKFVFFKNDESYLCTIETGILKNTSCKIPQDACYVAWIISSSGIIYDDEEKAYFSFSNTLKNAVDAVKTVSNDVDYVVETGAIIYTTGEYITNDKYYRIQKRYIDPNVDTLLIPKISNGYVLFYGYDKKFHSNAKCEYNGYYQCNVPDGAYYYAFIICAVEGYADEYSHGIEKKEGEIAKKIATISQENNNVKEEVRILHENVKKLNSHIEIKVSDFDDSALDDDTIIENAFNFAKLYEKKTIILDGRNYNISKAILVDSNTTIIIDGITIKQKNETFDNVFRGNNITLNEDYPNGCAQSIDLELQNIAIIGKNGAIISGCDINKKDADGNDMVGDAYGWRTIQILFACVYNFELCGITFEKTRCWCNSFEMSEKLKIHDLSISSTCANGDAVDIRCGCKDVEIYNISGVTTDDCIACTNIYGQKKSYPEELTMTEYTMEIARKMKPKKTLDELTIRNISIHDITATGRYHQVICCSAGLMHIENISICNCSCENKQSFQLDAQIQLYGSDTYFDYGTYKENDIKKIRINNIKNSVYPCILKTDVKVDDVLANKLIQNNLEGSVSSIKYVDGVVITNS